MGTLNTLYRVGTIPAVRGRRDGHDNRKQSGKMYDSGHFLSCKRDFIVPTRLEGQQQQQNYAF